MKRRCVWCVAIWAALAGFSFGFSTAVRAASEPIKIGAPLATAFLYGWDAERGIRLAAEEINAQGGVKVGGEKRLLEVEVIDTRDLEPGVPVDDAIKAVEKLILQKNVNFLVGGPVRSEAALAVMDLLNQYKKVSIITTGVLTPAYSKAVADNYDKYKYCFRNTSHIGVLGKDMMTVFDKIKAEQGLQKVYIMVQDVAHARRAGEFVEKLLKDNGYQVLGTEIYPTGTTDYAPGLLKAKKAEAEVLFIWMDMPETAILLKQWSDFRLKILPIGFIAAAEQPGFWSASKGTAQYTLVDLINGGNAPARINEWTGRFISAYQKRWGLEPEGYGTSSSYMAVYQIKDAVERAGALDADAVVKALETQDLMGVYGRMRFDPKTHQIIPSTDPKEGAIGTVFQWQDGKRVVVWPESIAVGTIKLPDWWKK
ncbi:MAG TPA: ABC transporter substrate-binding protein [Syntrophobacteraceae bacterium]|nr:ABC transporter substrate-binding protein [Syntrophobacteraceae bacterium]